jgi:SAM-dependent methyltransferase
MRVLDLACGEGRHSLAAAMLGADVVGVDRDESRLATARELAQTHELSVEWRVVDLVAPPGLLMMETFLTGQRELGWGPASDDHLLRPGELASLVQPLRVLHGREVLEAVDAERWRAVASVLAVRE